MSQEPLWRLGWRWLVSILFGLSEVWREGRGGKRERKGQGPLSDSSRMLSLDWDFISIFSPDKYSYLRSSLLLGPSSINRRFACHLRDGVRSLDAGGGGGGYAIRHFLQIDIKRTYSRPSPISPSKCGKPRDKRELGIAEGKGVGCGGSRVIVVTWFTWPFGLSRRHISYRISEHSMIGYPCAGNKRFP